MAMLAAEVTLSVEATTARSLEYISTRKMTVVTKHPQLLRRDQHPSSSQEFLWTLQQDSAVGVVTMMAEGVAHLRTLAMKERVIVMEPVMEVLMMEIGDVVEILSVEVTTASSLVRTTTRRMIAVRSQQPSPQISQCRDNKNKGGVSGPSGAPALPPVALAIA